MNEKPDIEKLRDTVGDIEHFSKELQTAIGMLIPVAQEYLKDVRNIRMAFAEEIREILRSVRQIDGITKSAREINDLGKSLMQLRTILSPEFVSVLERFAARKEAEDGVDTEKA